MLLFILAILSGLALLVWSADKFVDGAVVLASRLGMSPLLIGMLIIGFGTSAPEMVVSIMAALQGVPALALGNAYGSNITNIGLILGVTALISPVVVQSVVIRRELPVLLAVTAFAVYQLSDYHLTRWEGVSLLGVMLAYIIWSVVQARQSSGDDLSREMQQEVASHPMSLGTSLFHVIGGLVLLVISSRLLVWGAVGVAKGFGVSDLVIGLTVVAVGTSLPELASSIVAARKSQHDMVVGNVIGSNLFNTLAVVGLAAGIAPLHVEPAILTRDIPVMVGLSLGLFALGYSYNGTEGRIGRGKGAVLLAVFLVYTLYLVVNAGIG